LPPTFFHPSPNLSPQGRGFIVSFVFSPSLVERGLGGEVICGKEDRSSKLEVRRLNGKWRIEN
jgi:hypothetical protein